MDFLSTIRGQKWRSVFTENNKENLDKKYLLKMVQNFKKIWFKNNLEDVFLTKFVKKVDLLNKFYDQSISQIKIWPKFIDFIHYKLQTLQLGKDRTYKHTNRVTSPNMFPISFVKEKSYRRITGIYLS